MADQNADLQVLDLRLIEAQNALKCLCLQAQESDDHLNTVATRRHSWSSNPRRILT